MNAHQLGDPAHPMTLQDLRCVAFDRPPIHFHASLRPRIENSRRYVEKQLAEGRVVYGLNTGFGRLSSVRISPEQVDDLQRNLLRSHAAGVGEPLAEPQVRALIALRLNSLLSGFSGVRYELLEALKALLERRVVPLVPSRGSVGASGDLAPLAHVGLALMGEGEAFYEGQRLPAGEALRLAGLEPFHYRAKEALATINGTQLMCAVGGLALERAANLIKAADIVAAMTVEALMGTDTAFHESIHLLRPHPGQLQSAHNLRQCLKGSALVASHKHCAKVQDPYSLRCVPQVHGAAREGFAFARTLVEREMNSVTDNPLVFADEDMVLSGGNFHGAPVALALDCAALALSYLGTISERRCDRLLNPDTSELPPFLASGYGLNSGMMLVQYAAAALASENKVLCHPASADTIPTSGGFEDHVSMGAASAYKLERIIDHLEQILACEWVCVGEALEYRRPLTFGPATEAGYALLRTRVEKLTADRPLYADLGSAKELIGSGELVEKLEQRIGSLQ
jgi:histidine ammonia-lyase